MLWASWSLTQESALLGISWLIFTGFKAKFSAVKENRNSIVFKDTEASCCGLDRLNSAVESFGWSVADRGREPCQDSVETILGNARDFLDGFESAADGPGVP